MERIVTRIKMRPRRAEIRRTFFRVMIFIQTSLHLTSLSLRRD
jgi:hypothetical protein